MVPCIVVTRGGLGDVWLFESLTHADEHALVQFGDAICETPERLTRIWNNLELVRFAKRFGDDKLATEMEDKKKLSEFSDRLWNLMLSVAKRPPLDPAEVMSLVAEDRKLTRTTGVIQRSHPSEGNAKMADKTESSEKTSKPKGLVPRQSKYAGTSVISFGKDAKADRNYGLQPDGTFHNAKKPGSAAHARFAKMTPGMTVDEAIAAGVTRGDINWDVKQGFIKLT